MRRRLVPSVRFENSFAGSNGDKIRGLLYLNAIVTIEKAHVGKQRFVFTRKHDMFTNGKLDSFGNFFIGTSKNKVICLSEKKTPDATECGRVNDMVMCGAFEVQFGGKDD